MSSLVNDREFMGVPHSGVGEGFGDFVVGGVSGSQNDARYWIPPGGSATVGGYDIGDLVYVGAIGAADQTEDLANCMIDPDLHVASRAPSDTAAFFSYYSTYTDFSPSERRAYLQWLASGRRDPGVATPCVRLYVSAIEHRLLMGRADKRETLALLAELRRIQETYREDDDLARDLAAILQIESVFQSERYTPDPKAYLRGHEVGMSLPLSVALGKRVADGEPLPGQWLLCWWLASVGRPVPPHLRRHVDPFLKLFELRLAQMFPRGYTVRPPSRQLTWTYTSTDYSRTRDFDEELRNVPDVTRLSRPLALAGQIVAKCGEDLGPYARLLQRRPRAKGTFEALLFLPSDLALEIGHPSLDRLRQWVQETIGKRDGVGLVDDLLECSEGARMRKVQPTKLKRAEQALGLLGYGLAPSPGICDQLIRLRDPIAVFPARSKGSDKRHRPKYELALTTLRCAVFVALADGRLSEQERSVMEAFIDGTGLPEGLRDRLRADVRWLAARNSGLLALRNRCEDLKPDPLKRIRELAVEVSTAEGLAQPLAVKAVQKLYGITGKSANDAISGIHRAVGHASSRKVGPRATGRFRRRSDRSRTAGSGSLDVLLDAGRISAIQEDTQKVSAVLSEVFADEASASAEGAVAARGTATDGPLAMLDDAHRQLVVRLLEQQSWTGDALAALAVEFGLMPGGALEAVNEWSYEHFDDALLDEDEEILVNTEVAELIQAHGASDSNANL